MSRAAIVAEACRWIGTPYRHGAALRGIGCDCLGLVTGVLRAVQGDGAVPPVPFYAADWAEAGREERLMDALDACLPRLDPADAVAGDLLLFRWRSGRPAAHLAILSGGGRLIHAHAGAGVAEITLGLAWKRRVAGAFLLEGRAKTMI